MSVRRLIPALVIVCVIVSMSVGGTSARTEHAQKGFTLRVGLVFPFTGDLSTYGPSLDKAAVLAVKVINKALKKDHITNSKIQIVGSEDDQTQATAGVEAARKLVDADHAQVIIGSMSSSVTLAIAESVAIPDHVVEITPTSSDPSLTYIKGKNKLLWRIYPSDTLQGAALSTAMAKTFGKHATINVGARNDAFGTALAQVFEKNWKSHGGKIGKVVTYNPNETTFDSDAQSLASGSPAGWIIADFPPTFAKMGPALVRTGNWSPAKTYMTEAMDDNTALNGIGAPATEGLRGTAASAPKGRSAQALETLFKSTYPKLTYTGFEGTSFDAVMLAFLAALKAHSSAPDVLKNQLRSVSGPSGKAYTWLNLAGAIKAAYAGKSIAYEGAWTPINWDKNGDPGTALYVVWKHAAGQTTNIQTFTFKSHK